jgi:hypothetical protein
MDAVERQESHFDALDEALMETFPASDPIAISSPDEGDRRRPSGVAKRAGLGNP